VYSIKLRNISQVLLVLETSYRNIWPWGETSPFFWTKITFCKFRNIWITIGWWT